MIHVAEFVPLVIACLVMLGSPGPAPLALAACGASVGFSSGFRFYIGVMVGFLVALVSTLSGFFLLMTSVRGVGVLLLVFSLSYIAWLAFRIAVTPPLDDDGGAGRGTPGFVHGVLINIGNPKLYAAFAAMFAAFVPDTVMDVGGNVVAGIIMFSVAMITNLMWLAAGATLAQLFRQPRANRIIRIIFAGLMLLSVGFAIFGLLGQE